MASESVAKPMGMTYDEKNEVFGCLASIEALARLLQKAHENIENEHTGVYGTALVIEEKAQTALKLIG